jgi:hypothetical protein
MLNDPIEKLCLDLRDALSRKDRVAALKILRCIKDVTADDRALVEVGKTALKVAHRVMTTSERH